MKRRFLSIIMALALCMTLLPMTALAAAVTVKVGDTTLQDGKCYYVVEEGQTAAFTEADSVLEDVDNYLEYRKGVMTVHGERMYLPDVLSVSGGKLTVTGAKGTYVSFGGYPSCTMASGSTVELGGELEAGFYGIKGGTLSTASGYAGNVYLADSLIVDINDPDNATYIPVAEGTKLNLKTKGEFSVLRTLTPRKARPAI